MSVRKQTSTLNITRSFIHSTQKLLEKPNLMASRSQVYIIELGKEPTFITHKHQSCVVNMWQLRTRRFDMQVLTK